MRVLGVDLGGTKIEVAIAVRHGDALNVEARERAATPKDGYESVLDAVTAFVIEVANRGDVDLAKTNIGIGMPGGVTRAGLTKNSNTTALNGRPFRADLAARLRVAGATANIVFDNDANCFALAETTLGAAREHKEGVVFGVIMGTGVGAGIVLGGAPWRGPQDIAGEWGHHAVFHDRKPLCYCGNTGCLELYAAGPAVERDYRARSGEPLSLADIAARRHDDAHAGAAIELFLEAFGRGLANVIDILDPSAIVLGGGVSNLDLLYDEGVERIRNYVFTDELLTPVLRPALGDSAGVLGAALLASR
jgi:fructokinase